MEVGPLARMLVAYAGSHAKTQAAINSLLADLSLPSSALFSTLGRIAARAVETQLIVEHMHTMLHELESNINSGDLEIHNGGKWHPSSWPQEAIGFGTTEAPRGGLGHWVRIVNKKIKNYQAVVPTTWNGSPRDASGVRGPFEQSLIGTPVVDPEKPLEILRTIHSFDPCMACSVHILDANGEEMGQGRTDHQSGLFW